MMTAIRILLYALVLCLAGCKTAKVTETHTESCRITSAYQEYTDSSGIVASTEENAMVTWTDSIVERFREHIVTDSLGNVLWHEAEHTRDRYKGNTHSLSRQSGSRNARTALQVTAYNDTIYNGGSLKEVTVVRKRSWRWLWFLGLLAGLMTAGAIISRATK